MQTVYRENPINLSDVKLIVDFYQGNSIFFETLRQIKTPSSLFRVLSQFIEFNSVFAAGVANLAAQVAYKKELFRDSGETIDILGDKSCDVAALIYFAAIDEFNRNSTHRSMSKKVLRAAADFWGYKNEEANELAAITDATAGAIQQVYSGYCLSGRIEASRLFNGVGFHMGSEMLAVQEFSILHDYLQAQQPRLVQYLKSSDSYAWMHAHPILEEEHFQSAMDGGSFALQFIPKTLLLKAGF